jgi:hypothetical protein
LWEERCSESIATNRAKNSKNTSNPARGMVLSSFPTFKSKFNDFLIFFLPKFFLRGKHEGKLCVSTLIGRVGRRMVDFYPCHGACVQPCYACYQFNNKGVVFLPTTLLRKFLPSRFTMPLLNFKKTTPSFLNNSSTKKFFPEKRTQDTVFC